MLKLRIFSPTTNTIDDSTTIHAPTSPPATSLTAHTTSNPPSASTFLYGDRVRTYILVFYEAHSTIYYFSCFIYTCILIFFICFITEWLHWRWLPHARALSWLLSSVSIQICNSFKNMFSFKKCMMAIMYKLWIKKKCFIFSNCPHF